jgi:hypothetical protein
LSRGVKLARAIRKICLRMKPDDPGLRKDVLELIDELDRFLECLGTDKRNCDLRAPARLGGRRGAMA